MDNSISVLGSGWLGLPLIQIFAASGYTVKASTRQPEKMPILEQAGAQAFNIDLDKQILPEFLKSEVLIINITSKNKSGFAELIQQIEKSPIEKVLFVSSTSVYQNLNREVTEDECAEDHSSVLWQIEQLFQASQQFKTTIIRFSGLVDSRRHPGRFFQNGRRVPQADAPVNLIHLDDCLSIINAILQQQAWGETFNGCADTHPSKREFYSYARQLMGLSAPEFDTETEVKYKIISNEKVKTKLNYTFQHPDLMKIVFLMAQHSCPCSSGKLYIECCGLLHQGKQQAVNAEQLMRSRYSAFVMQNTRYLQATIHPSQRQPDDLLNLKQTMETTQWLGLTILDKTETGEQAEVEFIAFYVYVDKPIGQLHERSQFSRQQGQWFYMDGEFLPPIKLGRNDNCVCGSGKKLKRCHG